MRQFPELGVGKGIVTPHQPRLPYPEEVQTPPARTEFTFLKRMEGTKIEVFKCLHEYEVRRPGRVFDRQFTSYIAQARFSSFYYRPDKVLVMKESKDIANGAMTKLVRYHLVDGERRLIDLTSIRDNIDRFSGVWLKVDNNVYVTAQAFFGAHVDQDPRFERALEEGKMYFCRLDYEFQGELISIGISSDCNVVIYNEFFDEQSELELVLDVKHKLLDFATDR